MSFPAPAKSSIVTFTTPSGTHHPDVASPPQPQLYKAVTEGLASILLPHTENTTEADGSYKGNGKGSNSKENDERQQVFYNPIQNFNRDLSVLVIREFAKRYFEARDSKRKGKEGRNWELGNELVAVVKPETSTESSTATKTEGKVGESPVTAIAVKPPSSQSHNLHARTFSILDALSASGLRALRYSLEIPMSTSITANDLSSSAIASIKTNITYNHSVNPSYEHLLNKISPTAGNAITHMYLNQARYNVIDLDPYGTAAPFLDAALQALITKDSNGSLLCVTCTDAGVWASTAYSEKCYALYGGQPLKGEHCHEAGIRLILHSIASTAAKYGLAIEPLLSLSIDFYSRVFVKVWKSPAQVKHLASKTMVVYNCDSGCSSSWICTDLGRSICEKTRKGGDNWKFKISRAPAVAGDCQFCGSAMHIAGPMWSGSLHNPEFLTSLLSSVEDTTETDPGIYITLPRVKGMIQNALSESTFHLPSTPHPLAEGSSLSLPEPPLPPIEPPHFFHIPNRLSKTLHVEAPPLSGLRGALLRLGYKVSRSHCKPNSLKTTAPTTVVWEVMRSWCNLQMEKHPDKKPNIKEGMPGWNILFPSEEWINKNGDWRKLREWLRSKREEIGGKDPIVFDEQIGRDEDKGKVVRYQQNPSAYWGPMKAVKVKPPDSHRDILMRGMTGKRKTTEGSGNSQPKEEDKGREKKVKYDSPAV